MRSRFDEQLETLNNELIIMGALCENAIASAVKSLLENSKELAKTVEDTEKQIDQKERDIETLCMKLLLQQQPVAGDFRVVSSALKMITDMERIGDQAADIAGIIEFTDLTESKSGVHISDMAEAVIHMVTESIDAFVKNDAGLAKDVVKYDNVVDNLFKKVKADIVKLISEDASQGEQAIDILMIAKYLERIGDHAVNIAEWVTYSITGIHSKGE